MCNPPSANYLRGCSTHARACGGVAPFSCHRAQQPSTYMLVDSFTMLVHWRTSTHELACNVARPATRAAADLSFGDAVRLERALVQDSSLGKGRSHILKWLLNCIDASQQVRSSLHCVQSMTARQNMLSNPAGATLRPVICCSQRLATQTLQCACDISKKAGKPGQ